MTPLVLSERLALPTTILALAFVAIPLPKLPRIRPERVDGIRLAITAAGVAATTLMRFTGFACGIACAIVILCDRRRPITTRARWTAIICGAAVLPVVAIPLLVGGVPKSLAWHPQAILGLSVDVFGSWFLIPRSWPAGLRALLVIVLIVGPLVVAFTMRDRDDDRRNLATGFASFALAYFSAITITALLLDAVVSLNQRILSPLQPGTYLLLAVAVMRALDRSRRAGSVRFAAAAITISAAALLIPTSLDFPDARRTWKVLHDLQAVADRSSPLTELPTDPFIFTDDPPAAWNDARIIAYKLPPQVVSTTGQIDPDYEQRVDEVVDITMERDTLVIASNAMSDYTDLGVYLGRGLVVLARCPTLTVLGRPGSTHRGELDRGPCAIPPTTG